MVHEEKTASLSLQYFRCPYPQCGKAWPRRSDEVPAKCAKCQRPLRGRYRLDEILDNSEGSGTVSEQKQGIPLEIGVDQGRSDTAKSKWSPEVRRFVQILLDILDSDHPKAGASIRHNLEALDELIRRARGEAFDALVRKSDAEAKAISANATRPKPPGGPAKGIKGDPGKGRKSA